MKSYWIIIFLCCYLPLFVALLSSRRKKKTKMAVIKRRIDIKKGRENNMVELIKTFVGKLCTIHTIDDALDYGVYRIIEVTDNAVLCEDKKGNKVIANIDYITAIQEQVEKKK